MNTPKIELEFPQVIKLPFENRRRRVLGLHTSSRWQI